MPVWTWILVVYIVAMACVVFFKPEWLKKGQSSKLRPIRKKIDELTDDDIASSIINCLDNHGPLDSSALCFYLGIPHNMVLRVLRDDGRFMQIRDNNYPDPDIQPWIQRFFKVSMATQ